MTGNGKLGGRVSVWEVTKNWQKYKKCWTSSENPSTRHVGWGWGYMMVIQEVRNTDYTVKAVA